MRKLLVALVVLLSLPALAAPESIEGFTFGGSADEIVSRIGEPNDIEGPVFNKKAGSWVWSWDYSSYGALFEVEAESQDGIKSIRSLTIVAPCAWKLASGIGIGDSTDRILQVYPDVRRYQDSLWFAENRAEQRITGFELTGTKIRSIFIGALKQ